MLNSEHLSKQFDADLEDIRSRVMQMGGVVESQIMAAISGFSTGDLDVIARVIDNERQVDAYELQIDEACVHVVARRQPAASDLRLIMGVGKIVTDLERIGDEAEKIARMSKQIFSRGDLHSPRFIDVQNSGDIAITMLRRVLDALARMDAIAAESIISEDLRIDDEFRGMMRQLITYMMEDPRTITTALDILWIAKAIERIGDHAKNIAEQVIYIARGTDVRHAERDSGTVAGGEA